MYCFASEVDMRIALLLLLFICSQSYAFADYSNISGASKSERFGISYPEILDTSNSTLTPTRHHRLGRQSGIGSSNLQTTSATAESMSASNYKPTSVSPALQETRIRSGLERTGLFSQRMSSPALSPAVSNFPSLEMHTGSQSYFDKYSQPATGLESTGLSVGRSGHARSGELGHELIDPFKGL
jgi:hypothetical protein